MIADLPSYISFFFLLVVVITIIWLYAATKSKTLLMGMLVWATLQSVLAFRGVFQDTMTIPPKFMALGVLPTLVMILVVFLTPKGRKWTDDFNLKTLTYFHSIRIPVEIVLVLLFHQGQMSRYITFEGTNFDLFSGITAPIVAFLAFRSILIRKPLLIGWNIVCLLLLLNVVITAIFAIPSPFQKLSLDQPNVAVLYFPFNLLPSLVVPAVLFAHLVAIRRLLNR